MSIVTSNIKDELLKRTDPNDAGFTGYNQTETEAIQTWADALDAGCASITPSTTAAVTAKATFEAAAVGMSTPATGLPIFLSACDAYGAALGNGMTGYATVTNPAFQSTDFSDASLLDPSATPEMAATTQSVGVTDRMRTGVSQNLSTLLNESWN